MQSAIENENISWKRIKKIIYIFQQIKIVVHFLYYFSVTKNN